MALEPFDYINDMNEANLERVVEFLEVEHPQTIALVCLHLKEEVLTIIFNRMHSDLVSGVILRMLNVRDISHDVIKKVDRIFKKNSKIQRTINDSNLNAQLIN